MSLAAEIANQILFEIEEEVPFLEDFLEDYGKPYWEYGYVNHNPGAFNVAIPVIKDDEITSVFSFLQLDEEAIIFNFTSVEYNAAVKDNNYSITQDYIYNILEELAAITGKKLVDEASLRTECCPAGGNLTFATFNSSTGSWTLSLTSGSHCFCQTEDQDGTQSATHVEISCCNSGTGQVDGGAAEAGSDGATSSIPGENWIIFHSYWLNLWNGVNPPNPGIRPRENDNSTIVQTIINTQNEQELITLLQQQFGWDANNPSLLLILSYPHYIQVILEIFGPNGDNEIPLESIQIFIDFLTNHGEAAQLSPAELTRLFNLQPQGRGIINLGVLDHYLQSHDTDPTSVFVLKEILRLLPSNPELTSAGPSILDNFYRALPANVSTWIQDPSKDNFRTGVNDYLINGGPFEEVEARRNKLLTNANSIESLLVQFNIDEQEINLDFLLEAEIDFTTEITALMLENSDNENLMDAAGTAIDLQIYGITNQDQQYLNILSEEALEDMNPIILQYFISREIAFLSRDNPSWSSSRLHLQATFNVFLDGLHIGLDMVGFVPGAGEVADLINGAIYTIEGDGVNATLSFAAAIPFAGWASQGARYARKLAQNTATGTTAHLRWAIDAAGVVHFGYRGQLRTILKPAANHQAHHIIPWAIRKHPIIQKAAKANKNGSAFHPSDPFNGINVSNTRHLGSHPAYSNRIRQFLTELNDRNPNMTNNDALTQVEEFVQNLRNIIINNPNTRINDLIF